MHFADDAVSYAESVIFYELFGTIQGFFTILKHILYVILKL